jgi:hypothetical protein
MRTKGIGPQGLGMTNQMSDCCGIPNCGCEGSPNKIVSVVAPIVAKAVVDKVMD